MGAESNIAGLGASLYGQKHIISRWFVWVSIHYELTNKNEWTNKIYKLEKVNDRIPILQLDPGAKSKTKRDMNREKDGFKTRIRLKIRLKNSRNNLG